MESRIKLSTRGRITVPKALRLKVGLTKGARYAWGIRGNAVVLNVLKKGRGSE